MGLRGRSLLKEADLTAAEFRYLIDLAAAHDEGAHVTYLGPDESQLGVKESMKDTARVLAACTTASNTAASRFRLISAATAEKKAAAAQAALAGVRVAEVMTPDPELAPGWHSVAEFAAETAQSRQDVFPVVGFGGELTGVVLASQFDDIPASDRARLRVDQVALAVPPGYRAAPGDPAAPWPAAPRSVVRSPRWSWPTAG